MAGSVRGDGVVRMKDHISHSSQPYLYDKEQDGIFANEELAKMELQFLQTALGHNSQLDYTRQPMQKPERGKAKERISGLEGFLEIRELERKRERKRKRKDRKKHSPPPIELKFSERFPYGLPWSLRTDNTHGL